jgi:hypothetical protein
MSPLALFLSPSLIICRCDAAACSDQYEEHCGRSVSPAPDRLARPALRDPFGGLLGRNVGDGAAANLLSRPRSRPSRDTPRRHGIGLLVPRRNNSPKGNVSFLAAVHHLEVLTIITDMADVSPPSRRRAISTER